ncbi:MAG TPA: RlmE family RNA methyltransferase [Candidatus Binatia bacterium]|nr:RlmE family RNA methyltransferase [Candidatus Binatia bacterium]
MEARWYLVGVYQRKDRFYRQARSEGYRSRAAFKLIELDRRYHLFRRGDRVLDLGAWPGGWLQVAAQRVGERGLVVAVDRTPIDSMAASVVCMTADVLAPSTLSEIRDRHGGNFDVILSDMAPQLSGVRATDEARAAELAECALRVAHGLLRVGGCLIVKLFQSDAAMEFVKQLRPRFDSVKLTRPEATRSGSAELYAIAQGLRSVRDSSESDDRRNS